MTHIAGEGLQTAVGHCKVLQSAAVVVASVTVSLGYSRERAIRRRRSETAAYQVVGELWGRSRLISVSRAARARRDVLIELLWRPVL